MTTAMAKYTIVLARRPAAVAGSAALVATRSAETSRPAPAVHPTAACMKRGLVAPARPSKEPWATPSQMPVAATDSSVSAKVPAGGKEVCLCVRETQLSPLRAWAASLGHSPSQLQAGASGPPCLWCLARRCR